MWPNMAIGVNIVGINTGMMVFLLTFGSWHYCQHQYNAIIVGNTVSGPLLVSASLLVLHNGCHNGAIVSLSVLVLL